MLELYQAYADYHDLQAMVEELVAGLAVAMTGSSVVTYGGRELDLAPRGGGPPSSS